MGFRFSPCGTGCCPEVSPSPSPGPTPSPSPVSPDSPISEAIDCGQCLASPNVSLWVDVGSSFWSDANCDYCDQIQGDYEVVLEAGSGGGGPCSWSFKVDDVCTHPDSDPLHFSVAGSDQPGAAGKWKYAFGVEIYEPGGDAGSPLSTVTYESVEFSDVTDDCRSVFEAGPITLTKKSGSELHRFSGGAYVCSGTAPSTITLDNNP